MERATRVDFAGRWVSDMPATSVGGRVRAITTTNVHTRAMICMGRRHLPKENPEDCGVIFLVRIKILFFHRCCCYYYYQNRSRYI